MHVECSSLKPASDNKEVTRGEGIACFAVQLGGTLHQSRLTVTAFSIFSLECLRHQGQMIS